MLVTPSDLVLPLHCQSPDLRERGGAKAGFETSPANSSRTAGADAQERGPAISIVRTSASRAWLSVSSQIGESWPACEEGRPEAEGGDLHHEVPGKSRFDPEMKVV